jgi:response regulator RpfG family c-di-GMP phosphodiesterase
MTSPGARLLLVDGDASRRDARQFALESTHGHHVTAVASVRAARDQLAAGEFAAVITEATLGETDAIALLRRLPHETASAPVALVLADPAEQGLRRLAWQEGATAVLTEPVDTSELGAALRAALAVRTARLAVVAAEQRLAASMDHLTDVLVLVLDAAVPGSAHRGAELVRLVSSLCSHFEMEDTFSDDMRRAARLVEVGRFTLGEEAVVGPRQSPAGRCTMASARLVAQVPSLEPIASVIEHIGANWDGSGQPSGVQRGQIPLRSRLLRVGVDLLAAVERNALRGDPSLATAAEEVQAQSGRWYDPAVIAALITLAAEEHPPEWHDTTAQVTYDGLKVGMRLAGDLHTVSGVKLLSEGTVLTATTLQLLRRRHELDPLALPVPIQQRWS